MANVYLHRNEPLWDRYHRAEALFGEDSAACRAGVMKLEAVGMKLLVITLMTLAEIPCLKEHDKDSFFNENETAALKFHQEVVDILRLVIKVAPKGDVILRMMDTVLEKAAVGEFRKERKIFTDALFDFIDMNKDGKITPAEYAVYTDLFVKMSFDDDGAKAKLMAVFASLDLDKSSCLSKNELSAFVIKLFEVTVALILLLVTYAEVAVLELSDKAIRELMDFYIKYRVEYDFMKPEDLQKIDIREFNIMCKHPQWVEEYCKDVLKGHKKVMEGGLYGYSAGGTNPSAESHSCTHTFRCMPVQMSPSDGYHDMAPAMRAFGSDARDGMPMPPAMYMMGSA